MLGWCFQRPGEPKSTHRPVSLPWPGCCNAFNVESARHSFGVDPKPENLAAVLQESMFRFTWIMRLDFLRHLCQCHRFPCHCQPQFKRSSSNAITKDLVSVCQTLRYEMRRWDWLHWWGSPQPLFHESRWLCPHCTCFLRAQELGGFSIQKFRMSQPKLERATTQKWKKQEVAETDANQWCITTPVHARWLGQFFFHLCFRATKSRIREMASICWRNSLRSRFGSTPFCSWT